MKPACYYCLRFFENEDVLKSHQKQIHFKCFDCGKKFSNAPGMAVHMRTMHGKELQSVPKALEGRDDPTLNISGTSGVPTEEERLEANKKRAKLEQSVDSLLDSAAQAVDAPIISTIQPLINGMVYSDDKISPEERRAALPKYKLDEATISEKASLLGESIDARLQRLAAARQKRSQ